MDMNRIVVVPETRATEHLYRLPGGDLVRPSEIRKVVATKGDRPRVEIAMRSNDCVLIRCDTFEEACEIRDRIGRDLAPPTGFLYGNQGTGGS